MRELADGLRELHAELAVATIVPAGLDDVSRNVAAQGMRMISAGRAYLGSWLGDIVSAITALDAQIESYERTDHRNAART